MTSASDEVGRLTAHRLERCAAVGDELDVVEVAEHVGEVGAQVGVVLGHDEPGPVAGTGDRTDGRAPGGRQGPAAAARPAASREEVVDPRGVIAEDGPEPPAVRRRGRAGPEPDGEGAAAPTSLVTATVPPMSSVSCLTMARPMPAPSCERAPSGAGSRSKRAKTRSSRPRRMPTPVSRHRDSTSSSTCRTRSRDRARGVYFSALVSRLSTMRSNMSRSRWAVAARIAAVVRRRRARRARTRAGSSLPGPLVSCDDVDRREPRRQAARPRCGRSRAWRRPCRASRRVLRSTSSRRSRWPGSGSAAERLADRAG